MTIFRNSRHFLVLAIAGTIMLGGCSSGGQNSHLSLGYGGTNNFVDTGHVSGSDKIELRDSSAITILSRSPMVIVDKKKNRNLSHTHRQESSLNWLGAAHRRDGRGGEEIQETVPRSTRHHEANIDGGGSHGNMGPSGSWDVGTSVQQAVYPDVVTPVASTAYGSNVVVIKSVNGGFGMVLLKQGIEQNLMACQAFFKALPSRGLNEIEHAAKSGQGLFRPTYWLDRREERELDYRKSFQVASAERTHLSYFHTEAVVSGKSGADRFNCSSKVRNYNYAVSHALLKRLGLLKRRGPFFAAWRADGGKAMVLDLSQLDTPHDYKEAVATWMTMIVRDPHLWKGGVQGASLKQRLRRLLNKGGDSVLSLLVPTSVVATPF